MVSPKSIILFVSLLHVYVLTCVPVAKYLWIVLCYYRNDRCIPRRHMTVLLLGRCYVKMVVLMRVICSLFLQGLSPLYTSMNCLPSTIPRVNWNSNRLLNMLYLHCITYSISLLNGEWLRSSCMPHHSMSSRQCLSVCVRLLLILDY